MKKIKIAMLGCGVVGSGVVRLLRDNRESIRHKLGAEIELARVLVRDVGRDRDVDVGPDVLTDREDDVFSSGDIDVVLELMGGVDPARAYIERAFEGGASVVTANKMLLATSGAALLRKAVGRGVDLAFEASVGGGMPVVRTLHQTLAGDRVSTIRGIVNGTTNYVLSTMADTGAGFDETVKRAQELGYAEADPTLDVGGGDAAHKTVILAMLAFGADLDGVKVFTEGIEEIEPEDHAMAERYGFVIKHLGIAERLDVGGVRLRVHPVLVSKRDTIANVDGALNAVEIESRGLGPCLLSAQGAGSLPTAVSVVGDLIDVARARLAGAGGSLTRGIQLEPARVAGVDDVRTRYYLRFRVYDRPGVLGRIAVALSEAGVSVERVLQEARGGADESPVDIVLFTHEAREADVRRTLDFLGKSDFVAAPVRVLRVVA